MTCWHKLKWFSTVALSPPVWVTWTLAVAVCRVRCRHGVTNLSRRTKATSASDCRPSTPWVLSSAGKLIRYLHGYYLLPYHSADVFLFCFLYLSCALNTLSSTSWVDTPLTADWLQVCFGTRPRLSIIKHFSKTTYHSFNIIATTITIITYQLPHHPSSKLCYKCYYYYHHYYYCHHYYYYYGFILLLCLLYFLHVPLFIS